MSFLLPLPVHLLLMKLCSLTTAMTALLLSRNNLFGYNQINGIHRFTTLAIKNSLFRGKEILETKESGLNWYACGPTVYDSAHIGHARTYICTDIIRRILLKYFRIDVNFVMGMTDIDDKIINRAKESNVAWNDLAKHFEEEFLNDMDQLNVLRPDTILRVSEHIPDIIDYIKQIQQKQKSYQTDSGVYFDVKKCASYNKFVDDRTIGINDTSAVDEDADGGNNTQKKDPRDFALWKQAKPGEPSWPSPFGEGRPGWHIECSAATHAIFGEHVHIHSGGVDLKFPHHANEIAQCEAHNDANGWVQYWIHTGHLYIDGHKMSKSLKNFITVKEYLHSLHWTSKPSADLRMYFLQHKYHSPLHLSRERLKECVIIRNRIENFFELCTLLRDQNKQKKGLHLLTGTESDKSEQTAPRVSRVHRMDLKGRQVYDALQRCRKEVREHLSNDFDTPSALLSLLQLVSVSSQHAVMLVANEGMSVDPLFAVEGYVQDMLEVFGLDIGKQESSTSSGEVQNTPSAVEKDLASPVVDQLVSFRSRVRNVTLQAMKLLNKMDKKTSQVKSDEGTGQVNLQLDQILKLCDSVRADLAKELDVEIQDIGSNSIWNYKESDK